MQVQYRNCNYVGGFNYQLYQREGFGLLIFDNSQILMAKWKQNNINGPFVLISDRMRVLGTMNNNKLQGYNVISLQQSMTSNKKQKQRTIYGMFRDNKLYGKSLIIDGDEVILAQHIDGRLKQILQKKPLRDRDIYDMLQSIFPNQIYTISDWLNQVFTKAVRQFNQESTSKFQPKIIKYEDGQTFYGYSEIFIKNRSFGFILQKGQLMSVGDHDSNLLQGIGRAYRPDGTVEDGVFKDGVLNGIGISYSKKSHKYILGQHNQQDEQFEKGFGFPIKQISEIRRQFHLRSIYFYNDIVFFSFSTLFEAISVSSLQYNIEHESPRFSSITTNEQRNRGFSDKSPLREKISKYEEQSDHIDEPSPIKNKLTNDYDRNDFKRAKYFDSKQQREDKKKGSSRLKMETIARKRQISEQKGKSPNRKGKDIKDTKQFVRQLDEKERAKRNYLDQIYRQAKIYKKY